MKVLFVALGIIGVAIISILSFVIPSNPDEIIPSLTMMHGGMPLWLMLIISFSFIYLLILWAIYDKFILGKDERN